MDLVLVSATWVVPLLLMAGVGTRSTTTTTLAQIAKDTLTLDAVLNWRCVIALNLSSFVSIGMTPMVVAAPGPKGTRLAPSSRQYLL